MNEDTFRRKAKLAGFINPQVDFMWEFMAQKPHMHRIDEIDGLEDQLEEIGTYEPGEGDDSDDED